jgi:molecular chaperone GrpE
LRALADLENLRKRYVRELSRETAAERARVAAQWLPVVDNLERALEHAKADPSALIEGVRAVWEQAVGVLSRLGFPRFDDVGEPFDPSRHEAVSAVENDDAPNGTVVGSAWPGYGTGDTLLRPAGVVVAKGVR